MLNKISKNLKNNTEIENVFIYTISDPITNSVRYIGKTIDIKNRLRDHIKRSKNNKTHKDKWISSLIKQGHKPVILILDIVNKEDWIFWEKFYISLFKGWGFNLVNHTEGGDGGSFIKHTEETKLKISKSHLGKKRQPFTEEHKKNISKSKMGKVLSEEEKIKKKEKQVPLRKKLFVLILGIFMEVYLKPVETLIYLLVLLSVY